RGFITQSIRYTRTTDADVTNNFFYSARGEIIEQADAAGRKTRFDYDPMGRPRYREVFEANQTNPLAWQSSYYNANGEVAWSDGPRFDPEDYVWHDYDGAGRPIQEIHWRSRAKSDGSGVEAPPDTLGLSTSEGLFATSFMEYDGFGNLTRTIDARGV